MPSRSSRSAKLVLPAALLLAALARCSSSAPVPVPPPAPPPPPAASVRLPSPEEDPQAPGMIPQECEALLNKMRDWGFEPEKSWRPASPAIALEAADFFAAFHLVPQSTSNFARVWMNEPLPKNAFLAQRGLDRMDRAQSCDVMLAHKMLLALLRYPWPRVERPAAARDFLRFVLNQQARVAPSVARAVQIDILTKAVQRGFIRVEAKPVERVRAWYDARMKEGMARADQTNDPITQWKLNREELSVSEEAREKLARILPLP